MIRHHAAAGGSIPARPLYSSRSFRDLIYQDELARLDAAPNIDIFYTLTRELPGSSPSASDQPGPDRVTIQPKGCTCLALR
jgi:hypothetical protein